MKRKILLFTFIIVSCILVLVYITDSQKKVTTENYKKIAWSKLNNAFPDYYRIVGMNTEYFFKNNLDAKFDFNYIGDKSYVTFDEVWKYSNVYPLYKDYNMTLLGSNSESIYVSNERENLVIIEYEIYWDMSGIPHNFNIIFDTDKLDILGMIGID